MWLLGQGSREALYEFLQQNNDMAWGKEGRVCVYTGEMSETQCPNATPCLDHSNKQHKKFFETIEEI